MDSFNTTFDIIIIYLIIVLFIFFLKPNCLFLNENNKCSVRKFGLKKNETFITVQATCIITAIIIYLLFIFINFLLF